MFPLGDILVDGQHADSAALCVSQRQLVLKQKQDPAIARPARLFKFQHRPPRLDNLPISTPKKLGVLLPRHVEIGLADNFIGRTETGILGEQAIAANVNRIQVFPENPHRDGVQYKAKQFQVLVRVCRALRYSLFPNNGTAITERVMWFISHSRILYG